MTLSPLTNAPLNQNHTSQQKSGIETDRTEKSGSKNSTEQTTSENKFDDNVTLSQTEQPNASAKVLDKNSADTLLPQTMKSILANTDTAISAQANTSPQAARDYLAG